MFKSPRRKTCFCYLKNFENLAKIVIFKIKNVHTWMTTNDNIAFLGLITSTNLNVN